MLLKFKNWLSLNESFTFIFEEATAHFEIRKGERIENLSSVELPRELTKKTEPIISNAELKKEIIKKLVPEILTKIKRLEKSSFPTQKNIAYPIFGAYFEFDGKRYPINLVVESTNEKTKKTDEYVGNMIYVPIDNGKLRTLKVYDESKYDDTEILKNIEDSLYRRLRRIGQDPGQIRTQLMPKGDDFECVLTLNDEGKVIKKERARSSELPFPVGKDQQYNLAPGSKIKVFVKFANDYVEGEVVRINNKINDAFRNEGIGVDLKINAAGKEMTLPKKLAVGESIYLPVGYNNDWVKVEVSQPGYIIDTRMKEPINLRFKAK